MLLANALARAERPARASCAKAAASLFSGQQALYVHASEALDPRHLGMLVAMHEHRFCARCSVLQVLISGVELGKHMANALLPELKGESIAARFDPWSVAQACRWQVKTELLPLKSDMLCVTNVTCD